MKFQLGMGITSQQCERFYVAFPNFITGLNLLPTSILTGVKKSNRKTPKVG